MTEIFKMTEKSELNNTHQMLTLDFCYQMLARYKQDLDFFFGWGGRNEKRLFFTSFEEHILETRKLWNSLSEKPEWLTESDLDMYESLYDTPSPATSAEKDYFEYIASNA